MNPPMPQLNQPHRHTFKILSDVPGLIHGVFTRHGGVSAPPYASLNVVWNNGDSREAVFENLARVKRAAGVARLVASPQVHGESIHIVDETLLARSQQDLPVLLTPPGDALITRLRGVGLLIKVADCQAIFLVDPVRKVIANVHCGWRGSVKNFPAQVVSVLHERFGCRSEDLLATVGPSLGPCCAEFRNYRDELPAELWPFEVPSRPTYFNFWAISRRQLLDAGLKDEHIEIANRCTVCESDQFFSYRGERTTGRLAAVLAWKGDPTP